MQPTGFDVWGSRGARNLHGSRIGNSTSCYSVKAGSDVFVFDAGRGLARLSSEVLAAAASQPLGGVARVHILVTHAHLDHWEGLKDAAWMWQKGNGLEVTVLGPKEALDAIARGHQPPAFVPLEILAMGTLGRLAFVELEPERAVALPGASLQTVALHHYSGIAPHRRYLQALGYRLTLDGGPTVVYLNDHEPVAATRAMEDAALAGADLALVDANFLHLADHAFGHGSIESAAGFARRQPATLVLASHHGPASTDDQIEAALRLHGSGLANLGIAVEGAGRTWDPATRRFTLRA